MQSNGIGRKLKEARLARKMTQADVVGTFITRNMLSQIESGAANPSLRTLEYLSEVLSVPMDELLREDDGVSVADARISREAGILITAKEAFAREDFSEVELHAGKLLADDCPFRDEAHYLIAHAHFIAARRATDADDRLRAADHIRACLRHARKSLYAEADLRTDAHILLRALDSK